MSNERTYLGRVVQLTFIAMMLCAFGQRTASAQVTCGCELSQIKCRDTSKPPPMNEVPPFSVAPQALGFFAVVGESARRTFTVTLQTDLTKVDPTLKPLPRPHFYCIEVVGSAGPFHEIDHKDCGGAVSPPPGAFTTSKTFTLEFTPSVAGFSNRETITVRLLKDLDSSGCNCDCAQTIEVIGRAWDFNKQPSITISPDSIGFVIEPNDMLFPGGKPVTLTVKASNGDVIITEAKFLDLMGNDIAPNAPFKITGLPGLPTTVDENGMLSFMVTPTGRGSSVFLLQGILRVSAQGSGLGNKIVIDIPINLTDINAAFSAPTFSQWGMIIMSLLLVTVGIAFIVRRTPLMAEASGDDIIRINVPLDQPLFVFNVLVRALVKVLALVLVGCALVIWLTGSINVLDVCGTLICACILAYLIHLLLLVARPSQTKRE